MKTKPYLVCCSVLKDEIDNLSLAKDFNIVFLGMNLHSDYDLLEKNLSKVLEDITKKSSGGIVLVYGDYCLGSNGEMNELVKRHKAVKVDAVNCIDCLMGGSGSYLKVDPEGKLIFLSPGWIKYFDYYRRGALDEEKNLFREMFSGLEGIILLDTVGNLEDYMDQIQAFVDFSGLKILETRKVDTDCLEQLITKLRNLD